jgi:hypothetical protein
MFQASLGENGQKKEANQFKGQSEALGASA